MYFNKLNFSNNSLNSKITFLILKVSAKKLLNNLEDIYSSILNYLKMLV
ncbi:MAG: hypothetical protein ACRDCF_02155 [Mycoplasmoidaceae bacterium]